MGAEVIQMWTPFHGLDTLAQDVVDIGLILFHPRHVSIQRDQLPVRVRGLEAEQRE